MTCPYGPLCKDSQVWVCAQSMAVHGRCHVVAPKPLDLSFDYVMAPTRLRLCLPNTSKGMVLRQVSTGSIT